MADYCKQCSYVVFGINPDQYDKGGDLQGIITPEDTAKGLVSSVVICEGCGPIQVDHNGACVSKDCLVQHDVDASKVVTDEPMSPIKRPNQN